MFCGIWIFNFFYHNSVNIAWVETTSIDYLYSKVSKVGDIVKGYLKASFSIASTPRFREGRYSIP